MALECPQCKSPVAREGQRFCYRCGNDLRAYYDSLNIQIKDLRTPSTPLPASPPDSGSLAVAASDSSDPQPEQPEIETEPAPVQTQVIEITAETFLSDIAPGRKAMLRVLLPTGDVFDRDITQAETQIGKGPRNDVVIADPAVSTAHAVLRNDNGSYTIADLGSRNGTFINGERIAEPRRLNHGDVIGMGLSKLTFRLSGHSETGAIAITEAINVATPTAPPLTESALADAVIAEGHAQRGDVERLRGSDAQGRRLYKALVEEGLVGEETLRDLMSRIFQIPVIDLDEAKIDKAVATSIPARLARDRHVFAVALEGDSVMLAVADPTDTGAAEEVRHETGKAVSIRLATLNEILDQVDRYFGPRLIGVLPSGDKLEYFINQKEVEIGKAAHNHIAIADPTVSNTHAILMARDGGYSLVDLGSRNGTFINGERLGSHARTLRHGDSIQLGQTVLTFKNRAETTENVTATLSVEALEEVRRRAQEIEAAQQGEPAAIDAPHKHGGPAVAITPPADISPQPSMVAQTAAAIDATPQVAVAGDEEEKKEKKKKKKKKGTDERIRSAYIGAVSRVVAQVIAVLLSVGLALYIANRSMRGPDQPIETTAKGKPKIRVATPGTGSKIVGPLSATPPSRYQASGAVYLPDTDKVFFVVNDHPQLFWMQINESGQAPNTEARAADIKASLLDAEGITHDGSFFYVAGSQSRPEFAEGNTLVRFLFDPASETVTGEPEVVTDLRGFLIESVPEIKEVAALDKNTGGLNIEGIAWDDINKRLLLGLRSPVPDGKALIIPIRLTDPRRMSRETLQVAGPAIRLPLENLGIRDIQYDRFSGSFFIISGSPVSGGGFSLWQWQANEELVAGENPRKLADLDSTIKPEGVARVRLGTRDFVFIVGDSGNYKKIDITETP